MIIIIIIIIFNEEGGRIGMSVRVVETGGTSLKHHLVRNDLTGCIYPNLPKDPCFLCEADVKGGSHTKSGVHYSGECQLCGEKGIVAKYDGESGRNGYWRCTMFHKKEIIENKESNAFAKHLQIFHPDRIGDPTAFKLKVESTYSKPLERQVTEGIAFTHSTQILGIELVLVVIVISRPKVSKCGRGCTKLKNQRLKDF